ncbi:putative non-specific serine/threonine protein kinase [Helianthus annuus]|nr:putative non-specific serine/threonine protein kinase [Helianthus annuus]
MFLATGDVMESEPSTSSSIQRSQACRHFEFHEILLATKNFDESLVIGSGGFGKVYKGATEFWAEVEMLSMLRHCNLVSLILVTVITKKR